MAVMAGIRLEKILVLLTPISRVPIAKNTKASDEANTDNINNELTQDALNVTDESLWASNIRKSGKNKHEPIMFWLAITVKAE